MRQLFISSIIFIASLAFFLFEAPTTSTPKKQDKGALPITPETKKSPFDSLSNVAITDSLHVKI
jgi:hypothetical protein